MSYLEQIQKIVDSGKRPFIPKPVPQELLTGNKPLHLYDYQYLAVQQFLLTSRSIILYPTGFGKTHVGMEMMNQIKPRHLIIANKTAIPQWKKRIAEYTKIKESDYDIYTFQSAIKKTIGKHYNLCIIDEAHYSLADTYSQLLGGNVETFAALTASPYRRDGRDGLLVPIFVNPVGGDWKNIHNAKYYNPPTIHVWIQKTSEEKFSKFKELIQTEKKCLVYCDDISLGKEISFKYGIPFVHGNTPNDQRLEILNQSKNVMVSRVGDESISVDGIEIGIEIDWHGKSVRQAIQRAGRLMHNKSANDTQHHIIMTVDEYNKDKERLKGYYDKGLKVVIHKDDSVLVSEILSVRKESRETILKKVQALIRNRT